jgi:hypothetical protein
MLLLLWLEPLVVAPELRRSVWLSHGWHINHAILWWSTTRTTSGGSWHCRLPLLFLGRFTSLHSALLINAVLARSLYDKFKF